MLICCFLDAGLQFAGLEEQRSQTQKRSSFFCVYVDVFACRLFVCRGGQRCYCFSDCVSGRAKSAISHSRAGDEGLEEDPTDVGVQVLLFFTNKRRIC